MLTKIKPPRVTKAKRKDGAYVQVDQKFSSSGWAVVQEDGSLKPWEKKGG